MPPEFKFYILIYSYACDNSAKSLRLSHRSDLALILISLGSWQLQISQEKQYFSRFLYITTHDYKCYEQWDVIVLLGKKVFYYKLQSIYSSQLRNFTMDFKCFLNSHVEGVYENGLSN